MNKTIALSPAEILKGFANTAGIAAANSRVDLFKSNSDKMREIANGMRKVIRAQCDSYKQHVTETYLDCNYKDIKVSKRVARVPKYARSITK